MASPEATQEDSPLQNVSQQTKFAFVTDGGQRGARSHAMREHWKLRRHRLSIEKKKHELATSRPPPPLLPLNSSSSDNASRTRQDPSRPSAACESESASEDSCPGTTTAVGMQGPHGECSRFTSILSPDDTPPGTTQGIPAQALSGMNVALANSKLDPFDKFPVQLTPEHHKLLHHWVATYATMMFDRLSNTGFNPMRDVWLPLDLSNAASFNALMAHSAAHLARLQGYRTSDKALEFKAEAIRIVTLWMGDPALCLSDEIIAAVLRLLTFERYWGTEEEWRVHHEGLARLIQARGGIEALQSNTSVGLPAYLVSLMSRPSWFHTSNQIGGVFGQHLDEWATKNIHKIRCLWLLSFVQDIGTFICNNPSVHIGGLLQYPTITAALEVLYAHSKLLPQQADANNCGQEEFKRLACLLYICVLIQEAFTEASDTAAMQGQGTEFSLELLLDQSRDWWQCSIDGLYDALFQTSFTNEAQHRKRDYVLHMAMVLRSLSNEARRGVESCLLGIMRHTTEGGRGDFLHDDQTTADSLLASIHGD